MAVKQRPNAFPPTPKESAALRGALTPACILINIIPPSINSKSTCFTPGEKNNPRLVSPASPGAAEGLNSPPRLSTTFFSLGAAVRVQCSLPQRWLWHQKVAAWGRGRSGRSWLLVRHGHLVPALCSGLSDHWSSGMRRAFLASSSQCGGRGGWRSSGTTEVTLLRQGWDGHLNTDLACRSLKVFLPLFPSAS